MIGINACNAVAFFDRVEFGFRGQFDYIIEFRARVTAAFCFDKFYVSDVINAEGDNAYDENYRRYHRFNIFLEYFHNQPPN